MPSPSASQQPVDFPNPDGFDVLAALAEGSDDIGDIWEAARAAGVKAGTISTWISRGKVEPLVRGADRAGHLFHLPTIRAAAARRPGRPSTSTAA